MMQPKIPQGVMKIPHAATNTQRGKITKKKKNCNCKLRFIVNIVREKYKCRSIKLWDLIWYLDLDKFSWVMMLERIEMCEHS